MDYFGVTAADIPCVFAVKVPSKEEGGGGMKKYKGPDAEGVVNEETMKKFFNDFGMYVCMSVCMCMCVCTFVCM